MSELFQALWDAPLSMRGTLTFGSDGTVDLLGTHHGETVVLGVRDVPALGRVVTLRETGGKHWAARGTYAHHGPQVQTILLDSEPRIGRGMISGRMWRYVLLSQADYPRSDAERLDRGARLVASADLAQHPVPTEAVL